MTNVENKCTLITSTQSFSHYGQCDGTIVPIFNAKTKNLPTVTLTISNSYYSSTCPITLTIKTKKQDLTEIIPPNTAASFTFESVMKIEVACSNGDPLNICSFYGDIQISHRIRCHEWNTASASNFIPNCTCEGKKFNCSPSQKSNYAYHAHQGSCDNCILPVYLTSNNVRPTITLSFYNFGDCSITLTVERYGGNIIDTIQPGNSIGLTVDDVISIKAKCDSCTATQLCGYQSYLDISFCICCNY